MEGDQHRNRAVLGTGALERIKVLVEELGIRDDFIKKLEEKGVLSKVLATMANKKKKFLKIGR